MLIILSGSRDSNFNPVLLKVKLCADLQTTKLVAQSSQSRPRNNLSFCSDDCSYQSQLRTIIWALHLTEWGIPWLWTLSACEEGPGLCSFLLTIVSFILIVATLPFSLLYTIKVVQEYERAVIFRLGRLLSGGARGPGVFFIIPCVDVYEKIDLRTSTYEIPPQEVYYG